MLEPVRRLVAELARLPGIGEKTAERLAFHLLAAPKEEALRLSEALRDVREKLRLCETCQNLSETTPCSICSNPKRDPSVVMVVETFKDVWTLERTSAYHGVYHVLHGRIAPLDGVGPEQLTIGRLKNRITRGGGIAEVILATNPTAEGDTTASYVQRELASLGVKITRIARGLPPGATIEYANRAVLAEAIAGRRAVEPL